VDRYPGGTVKAKVLIAVGVVVVVGVVTAVVLLSRPKPEWTTASPQALAEFEKGLDALQKVYYNEAAKHFEKALQLDPGFVIAKRFLLGTKDSPPSDEKRQQAITELKRADALANLGKEPAKALQILDEYSSRHANDPYALEILANQAAERQDWAENRRLLTRLIEVAPNRVVAYNQLGYLEMGLGQFAQSEKMFGTYRYIAPDQANPQDSLGELYILIGRYADAQRELEGALKIRPDFCASYEHLARLALMDGRPDDARAAIARAEKAEACPAYTLKAMGCQLASWVPFLANDWQGVWNAEKTACAGDKESFPVLELWAALKTGRRAEADSILGRLPRGATPRPFSRTWRAPPCSHRASRWRPSSASGLPTSGRRTASLETASSSSPTGSCWRRLSRPQDRGSRRRRCWPRRARSTRASSTVWSPSVRRLPPADPRFSPDAVNQPRRRVRASSTRP
jgi:Flp pilus assembly protein TadD